MGPRVEFGVPEVLRLFGVTTEIILLVGGGLGLPVALLYEFSFIGNF